MYPEIKTILYATDLGDHMRPVFHFALGVAKKYGARIIMLHVAEPLGSSMRIAISVYMPEVKAQEVLRDGLSAALATMHKRLDKFCEDALAENPADREIVAELKVVSGRSAETIVEQAIKMEADLIIVGTHTDPSMGAQLHGSIARNVTQLSKIPVLVVPVFE